MIANGDFTEGKKHWTVVMHKDAAARTEIVPDGFEGKPALLVDIGETDTNSWNGRIYLDANLEPKGVYTVKVHLMCEPADQEIQLSVWGRNKGDKSDTYYLRKMLKVGPLWQEYSVQFQVKETPKETYAVSFGNLIHAGNMTWIADVRLTRDEAVGPPLEVGLETAAK